MHNINQTTIIPVQVKNKKSIGKDNILGKVGIPMAGLVEGVERKSWYNFIKEDGEIEISVLSSFTVEPCNHIVYAANIQYFYDGKKKKICFFF